MFILCISNSKFKLVVYKECHILLFIFLGKKKKAFLLQIIFFYRKSYCTFSIERNSGNSKISQIVPCLKYFTFPKKRRAFNQKKKGGVKVVLILQCERRNVLNIFCILACIQEITVTKTTAILKLNQKKIRLIIKCNILHNYLLAITPFICRKTDFPNTQRGQPKLLIRIPSGTVILFNSQLYLQYSHLLLPRHLNTP